ncbi:MAG: OmpA family protein, partial [Methylocystis sp.]|nr:OmpA family protein [Methylocystis sp.]
QSYMFVTGGRPAIRPRSANPANIASIPATYAASAARPNQTAPPPAPSSAVETPAGDAPPSDQASATPSAPPAVEPNKEAANAPAPVEAKPATPVERLAAAKEKLAALPAAGPLDAAACESALNASVTVEKIQFRSGRPSIANASVPLLNRLAALLKRCPDAKVEISGYTDNVGPDVSNQKLSQRRAEAVRDYLKGQGVRGDRLTAIGRGSANPVASNDTEEGRAENRRIEFTVK